jgi:hypothetical protein
MTESQTRTHAGPGPSHTRRLGRLACLTAALCLVATAMSAALASAAEAAPVWKVRSFHSPTNFVPGETGKIFLRGDNVGDANSAGFYTIRLHVPPELTVTAMSGTGWLCTIATASCRRSTLVRPGGVTRPSITVTVSVAPTAAGTLPLSVEMFSDPPNSAGAVPDTFDDPITIGSTPPGFGIAEFEGQVRDENREPFTQAGGHPFEASTAIEFNTILNSNGHPVSAADARDIRVDLPPGFVGDPTATPKCSLSDFNSGDPAFFDVGCPASTQVGVAWNTFAITNGINTLPTPVFNLEPAPGVPAMFGMRVATHRVILSAGVRSEGDYGVFVTSDETNAALALIMSEFTFWGVPADPGHDNMRGYSSQGGCLNPITGPTGGLCPSDAPPLPFLTNPMDCSTGPLTTNLGVESWQVPGSLATASFDHDPDGVPMAVEGCERVPFNPSIRVQPTNTQPDSPTGLDVELSVPQSDGADGLASAHLEKAVVTLPEGMTVNPSSADGLQACSPAQIGLDSRDDPTCPEASKIGSVEVDTPLLEETMTGSVYVAKQTDNPFRSLLAIYIVAKGPGVIVKLAGKVDPDPVTGRLTTTFDNNPQLPFNSFKLRFKAGPRAPLATPPTCGMKVVETSLTPYSAYPEPPAARVADPARIAHPSDTFTIDCPGISGFAPSFEAGTTNPSAGAYSSFALRINRADGQQYMNGLVLEMPPGLIANLRGVPLCPNAQADAGTCDAGSKIGTAVVGAGAGTLPFFTAPQHGSVYITEGYKGAPYGLSSVVRAIAGPYDLGTVVVRQAIFVDRTDAHLTVVSDPLPTILEGIPLRLRSINVDIDRPGFVINPTSCGEKQIKATIGSTEGAVHRVAHRFQIGDCQALPLRPRFRMRMTGGRRQMREGRHPGLRTVVTQGPGQANMKKVAVKLPLSLALDPENAQSDALCEFEAGQRVDCPPSSIIGHAIAHTPVLNRPLTGPVYFVKNVRIHPRTGRTIRTLPTLLITLRGEVAIDVRANSDVIDNKLVSTFHTVPDAPVSRFELSLKGGKKGILVATRNICSGRKRHVTDVEIDGQNGKRADQAVRMRSPCAKKKPARSKVRSQGPTDRARR